MPTAHALQIDAHVPEPGLTSGWQHAVFAAHLWHAVGMGTHMTQVLGFWNMHACLPARGQTQALKDVQRLHGMNGGTGCLLYTLCRPIDIFQSLG